MLQRKAVNRVGFSVAGLGMLSGSFTIEASYTIASPSVSRHLSQNFALQMFSYCNFFSSAISLKACVYGYNYISILDVGLQLNFCSTATGELSFKV